MILVYCTALDRVSSKKVSWFVVALDLGESELSSHLKAILPMVFSGLGESAIWLM